MITSARQLKRQIQTCEIPHESFVRECEYLEERINDALDGFSPCIECIVGPSRVGKTMVRERLARAYPEQKVDGRRIVSVLVVKIPPGVTPRSLPIIVLEALGLRLNLSRKTAPEAFERVLEQLQLAQTKVIIFEEASHLVEHGARILPRDAGDWIKSLVDEANVTAILFGVPRLRRLFDSNEQLRMRTSARREFRPYDWQDEEERGAFEQCVETYVELFSSEGWLIDLPLDQVTLHCYILTGGLIGVLSKFFQELASRMTREQPRRVTLQDLATAAGGVEGSGYLGLIPFRSEAVAPVHLSSVHAHVLTESGLGPRHFAAGGLQ